MSSSQMLCKVCCVLVPRRKDYQPSTCEACQKFFRRTCPRRHNLKCINGTNPLQCDVADMKGRRICSRCRFAKCISIGMSSKYLGDNNTPTAGSLSPSGSSASPRSDANPAVLQTVEPKSSMETETAVVKLEVEDKQVAIINNTPLVRDPVLFDGSGYEEMLRNAALAYTALHGLEFCELRNPKAPIADLGTILQVGFEQLSQQMRVSSEYGQHFADNYPGEISQNELQTLIGNSVNSFAGVFNNLSGNRGSSFFGLNDQLAPLFFKTLPEYLPALNASKELTLQIDHWNPSFPEAALLLGALFFNDDTMSNPRVLRFQQRILQTYHLYSAAMHRNDAGAVAESLRHFKMCLLQTKEASNKLLGGTMSLAARSPFFATVIRKMANFSDDAATSSTATQL